MTKLSDTLNSTLEIAHKMTEAAVSDYSIQEAVSAYRGMRLAQDELKEALSKLTEDIDKMRQDILPARFKETNLTSITVSGYRFTITHRIYASIKSEKKPEAFNWLRENNLKDLIQEHVWPQTLSATAKDLMERGFELDPELFDTNTLGNVSITKTRGTEND